MSVEAQRYVWIDLAKSLAIFLVVIGHAWRGLHGAGLVPSEMFHILDNAIYYFHMPLFLMISGFLFHKVYKRDWKILLNRQWVSIIWPYIFWSVVIVFINTVFSSSVNNEIDSKRLLTIAYKPISIFWFFYVIFVSQLFVKAIFEKFKSAYVLLLIGTAFWVFNFVCDMSALGALDSVSKFMIFFIIGFFFAIKDVLNRININGLHSLMAFMLFFIAQLTLFIFDIGLDSIVFPFAGIILSLCVIIFCIWTSQKQFSASPIFIHISTGTLVIYVSHVIFTAGTRIVLMKFSISDMYIHIVCGTLLGLVCPLVAYDIAARFKITSWVGLYPHRKI